MLCNAMIYAVIVCYVMRYAVTLCDCMFRYVI